MLYSPMRYSDHVGLLRGTESRWLKRAISMVAGEECAGEVWTVAETRMMERRTLWGNGPPFDMEGEATCRSSRERNRCGGLDVERCSPPPENAMRLTAKDRVGSSELVEIDQIGTGLFSTLGDSANATLGRNGGTKGGGQCSWSGC